MKSTTLKRERRREVIDYCKHPKEDQVHLKDGSLNCSRCGKTRKQHSSGETADKEE